MVLLLEETALAGHQLGCGGPGALWTVAASVTRIAELARLVRSEGYFCEHQLLLG